MKEFVAFGEKDVDDLAIHPEALRRLEAGGRYVMLLEGEDEPMGDASWPKVEGNRIVFISLEGEDDPFPAAVVSPDLANDPAVLGEIASDGDQGDAGVSVVFGPGPPLTRKARERRGATLWDAAVIACKIMALLVLVTHLGTLQGGAAGALFDWREDRRFLINAAFTLLFAAVGLALWMRAPQIADRMVPRQRRDRKVAAGSPADLQVLLFSIIGLFLLAQSVPFVLSSIAGTVSAILETSGEPPDPPPFGGISPLTSFFVPQLIGSIARMILGAWLLLGSERIVRWVSSKRPSFSQGENSTDE